MKRTSHRDGKVSNHVYTQRLYIKTVHRSPPQFCPVSVRSGKARKLYDELNARQKYG